MTFKHNKDGHWIAVVINIDGMFSILVNFLGFNNTGMNRLLLGKLTEISTEFKQMYGMRFRIDLWLVTPEITKCLGVNICCSL